ncbi:hypothetical protein E2K93_00560 [Thalassotalea sp. HSM 43]|uniref:AMP-dependent synthetase/ligase n=1 Tax=Thalassotalea sp. HSM 43 TaxID=2552945 RepID=UPI0010813B22|nr:AMP-binding protein [Thalassotalea sp. HSM 43]QBY02952.1 hypothetical protein E2K93_00560 [Thalassotalea sp. HSM 43]
MDTARVFAKMARDGQQDIALDFAAILTNKGRRYCHQIALTKHNQGGQQDMDETLTYRQLVEQTKKFANLLQYNGIKAGDKVAILTEARPYWALCFFAVLAVGAIVVPVDPKLTEVELLLVINDANPALLLASEQTISVADKVAKQSANSLTVFNIDAHLPLQLQAISSQFASNSMTLNSTALICYTSGTTGKFKGVEISYKNLFGQVENLNKLMQTDGHEVCVSILPLHHLFELSAGLLGVLWGGGQVCYLGSLIPDDLLATMRNQKATFLLVVPLFLSLLKKSIVAKVAAKGYRARGLFNLMYGCAKWLPLSMRKRLFAPLHRQFGANFKHFSCGGAPLDIRTLKFFSRLGFTIYQGYGLTETSPVIATNTPNSNRFGSVGKPIPGCEVKIIPQDPIAGDKVGEIATRGHHVMRGYHQDERLTEQTIDTDNWLHTGDLGYIDRDGFLYITGRKKNTIVLGDGQNIQPEQIEPVLLHHKYIQEGCVVAIIGGQGMQKGKPLVCAVAVAKEDIQNLSDIEYQAKKNQIIEAISQNAQQLSAFKRPHKIVVLKQPLPRSTTRKIKRPKVAQLLNQMEIYNA